MNSWYYTLGNDELYFEYWRALFRFAGYKHYRISHKSSWNEVNRKRKKIQSQEFLKKIIMDLATCSSFSASVTNEQFVGTLNSSSNNRLPVSPSPRWKLRSEVFIQN